MSDSPAATNKKSLKLDFNERCDKVNPLTNEYTFGDLLWQYPDREPLEKCIAVLNNLAVKQVICTNGGDEAIMILMRIVKEGTSLILPLPAFSQYTWGVKSWQQQALLIDAKSDLSIDIETTKAAIKQSKNAVTILTRPNNPTGESIALSDLTDLIATSQISGGWVFLDEAYIEFSEQGSVAESLLQQYDNLIILRTFSKAYGLAGIRLGYLLGSERLVELFKQRCMPFNIPTPSLQIANKALDDINQAEMQTYCQQIRSNRKTLIDWFSEKDIKVFPSQANFVLLQLPFGQAKAIKSFMAKNNILLRTFDESELESCLRIAIPFETQRLLSLLEQCFSPKLICLDMDGVLIDTSGSYDQCVLATVKQLSGKQIALKDIESLRRQGGFNNDWVLSKRLLSDLGFDFSLQKVTAIFQQLYLGKNNDGLVANEISLISSSLHRTIDQSKSCRFSVVTGRPRQEAISGRTLVELSELDLISLDDVEAGKPSPEGIQKLQQKYSMLSWMCGDNPDDMQAAVESNSLAIGIGENKVESLYQAGADIVLKDINELEKWLCPIK